MRSIVEITPQDVQQKQFDYVKRGFDPQQVEAAFVATRAAARAMMAHRFGRIIKPFSELTIKVRQIEEQA